MIRARGISTKSMIRRWRHIATWERILMLFSGMMKKGGVPRLSTHCLYERDRPYEIGLFGCGGGQGIALFIYVGSDCRAVPSVINERVVDGQLSVAINDLAVSENYICEVNVADNNTGHFVVNAAISVCICDFDILHHTVPIVKPRGFIDSTCHTSNRPCSCDLGIFNGAVDHAAAIVDADDCTNTAIACLQCNILHMYIFEIAVGIGNDSTETS